MAPPWQHHIAALSDFRMHYVRAGAGDPLVLLHGWPQTWYEWRKVIPALAEEFTVIAPDLRGLGDSERPLTGYDKRTLGADVAELVRALGFERIGVLAHDWGAAAAYYLAYDHPGLVERLMILDMIPGLGRAGDQIALGQARWLWHVFFHGGAPDLAEKLVSGNLRTYLSHFYTSNYYNYSPVAIGPEDIDEYVRAYSQPGALRAGFQYYRAGLQEDLENLSGCDRKLAMPVLAWGGEAFLGDIVPFWQAVAENVTGGAVPECGHFVAEEKPDFVIAQARAFFGSGVDRGDSEPAST